MALNTTLYATKNPAIGGSTFVNADGTAVKTIYTAPSGGSDEAMRVMGIMLSTDDTVANDVFFYINDGSTDRLIHHVDLPASSGTDGTNNVVDGLNLTNAPWMLRDSNNNRYFDMKAGWILKAKVRVAVTAAKTLNCTVLLSEYKQ